MSRPVRIWVERAMRPLEFPMWAVAVDSQEPGVFRTLKRLCRRSRVRLLASLEGRAGMAGVVGAGDGSSADPLPRLAAALRAAGYAPSIVERPPDNPPCDHEWEPVEGKFGKYQCARCPAKGYRAALSGRPQADNGPDRGKIVPYASRYAKLPWGEPTTADLADRPPPDQD